MASEITVTASLSVIKGGASVNTGSLSKTIDMTGTDVGSGTQNVATIEQLTYNSTDITGTVDFVLKNNDAAASCTITTATPATATNVMSVVPPGGFCLLMGIDPSKIFMTSSSGTIQISWWMTEV